jgi:DNA-binding IscR family transcriptional regulator
MSVRSLQFAVCTHIATVLAYWYGESFTSAAIADSVNAEPSFVRRSVAKLTRAGLVVTTRGKSGASTLARAPEAITLLDIYRAAEAPPAASPHAYAVQPACPVSVGIQPGMAGMLEGAQAAFEAALGQRTLAELVADIRAANGGAMARGAPLRS